MLASLIVNGCRFAIGSFRAEQMLTAEMHIGKALHATPFGMHRWDKSLHFAANLPIAIVADIRGCRARLLAVRDALTSASTTVSRNGVRQRDTRRRLRRLKNMEGVISQHRGGVSITVRYRCAWLGTERITR